MRLAEDVRHLPELRPLTMSAAATAWMIPELGLPRDLFGPPGCAWARMSSSSSSRAAAPSPTPAVAAVAAAAPEPHPPIPPSALRAAVAHDVVVRRDRQPGSGGDDEDGGGRLGPLVAACSVLTVPLHHVATADDEVGDGGDDGDGGGVVLGVILNDVAVDRVAASFGSSFVAAATGRFCYFSRTGEYMTASRVPDGRTIASVVRPRSGRGESPRLGDGPGAAAPAAELEWLKVGWSSAPSTHPLTSAVGSAATAPASAAVAPRVLPGTMVVGSRVSLLHHRVTPPAAASHQAMGSSPVAPWASAMDALIGTFGSAVISKLPVADGSGIGASDGVMVPLVEPSPAVVSLVTTVQRSGEVAIARLCCRAVASGREGGVPHPAALRLPQPARAVVRQPPVLLPARLPFLCPAQSGSSNGVGVSACGVWGGGHVERTGASPCRGTSSTAGAAAAPLRRRRINVDALPTAAARARAMRNRASAARSNAQRKRARLAATLPDGSWIGAEGGTAVAAEPGESDWGGEGGVQGWGGS